MDLGFWKAAVLPPLQGIWTRTRQAYLAISTKPKASKPRITIDTCISRLSNFLTDIVLAFLGATLSRITGVYTTIAVHKDFFYRLLICILLSISIPWEEGTSRILAYVKNKLLTANFLT